MSIYVIYRICIWLPVIVPAILIVVVNALGIRQAGGLAGELLAYSLIWGGLPYAALAVWATKWVSGRPEADIRRLMFRAPLLMVALFVPAALVLGLLAGAPVQFAALAALGSIVILLLGYGYVLLTVMVRFALGPAGGSQQVRA